MLNEIGPVVDVSPVLGTHNDKHINIIQTNKYFKPICGLYSVKPNTVIPSKTKPRIRLRSLYTYSIHTVVTGKIVNNTTVVDEVWTSTLL